MSEFAHQIHSFSYFKRPLLLCSFSASLQKRTKLVVPCSLVLSPLRYESEQARGPLLPCYFVPLFRSQALHPLSTNHTGYADDDEWDAQQLAHIEQHARLEINLYVLCVLDEEAECEDERQHKAEEESAANWFS